MPVQIHYFKCWPEPFEAAAIGTKTHEIRKDDRPQRPRVGDIVVLQEWRPDPTAPAKVVRFGEVSPHDNKQEAEARVGGDYTGRDLRRRVTHVTEPGEWGLPSGLYVMSLRDEGPR